MGPYTVDRFADVQVERFNLHNWNPGSEAVDAFTYDWGSEHNWWCPPPFLNSHLLRHAQGTKAVGTLVAPQWYSVPYWPLLFPDGTHVHPAKFIKEIMVLLT